MRLVAIVALIAVAACGNNSTTPTAALTAAGKWTATLVGTFTPGGSGVMALSLTQAGATVSGNGTFTDPTDPPPGIMSVTGTVSGSNVALTIQVLPQGSTDQNKPPMQFTGKLDSATTMSGVLDGGRPPVASLSVTFKKQ